MAAERLRLAFVADPNSIHTRRWLGFFASRGHEVHLLAAADQAIDGGLPDGVAVHRFASYGTRLRPLGAIRARRSLRALVGRLRPDVLHAHYLTRYGWLAMLAGFRPLAVTVWGSDVFVTPHRSLPARLLARRVLREADVVTAVSRALADAAVECGAKPERIRIIQFGVDPVRFSPGPAPEELRERLGLTGRRVVFAPRALRPVYRQEVVVRALAELPDDVALVLSEQSADSRSVSAIRDLMVALAIEPRVRFVASIPHAEMPAYYRLANVVVSVPESDAFPVTALEAMACGQPVVLSDLSSTREGLGELVPWARVPVGDSTATARAIDRALGLAATERAELGAALRSAALERTGPGHDLTSMEAEYRRLAGRGRR